MNPSSSIFITDRDTLPPYHFFLLVLKQIMNSHLQFQNEERRKTAPIHRLPVSPDASFALASQEVAPRQKQSLYSVADPFDSTPRNAGDNELFSLDYFIPHFQVEQVIKQLFQLPGSESYHTSHYGSQFFSPPYSENAKNFGFG